MRPACIMEDRALLSAWALSLVHSADLSNGLEDMVIFCSRQRFYNNIEKLKVN